MEKDLQGKAMMEILKSCDVIIASGKKGIAEKVGKKLGGTLNEMGVKSEEAKILFQIIEERLLDDSGDTEDLDFCVFLCSDQETEEE